MSRSYAQPRGLRKGPLWLGTFFGIKCTSSHDLQFQSLLNLSPNGFRTNWYLCGGCILAFASVLTKSVRTHAAGHQPRICSGNVLFADQMQYRFDAESITVIKWPICSTFHSIQTFSLVARLRSPLVQVKPAGGGTTRDVRPQDSTLL